MKLAVITFCRNEEKIIPYFIHHYSNIADLIILLDHESTDDTKKIAAETAKKLGVKLHIETVPNNGYDDVLLKDIKEKSYKPLRNIGFDVAIVCDADEFWHHTDGTREVIKRLFNQRLTTLVIQPEGYQMVASSFPEYTGKPLIEIVKDGSPDEGFNKPLCFHTAIELHGMMGMHRAYHYLNNDPVLPIRGSGMKLLHYKFLGLEHRIERIKNSANNLSPVGKDLLAKGIGIQFECNEVNLTNEFNSWKDKAKPVEGL
jgi:glycosyltransferase involved in cell wall biosynthesis